jgi:hypothetical protein
VMLVAASNDCTAPVWIVMRSPMAALCAATPMYLATLVVVWVGVGAMVGPVR